MPKVDAATLLVSEVVSNAILHAGTDVLLRCNADGDVVRIEVGDGSPVVPAVRHYDEEGTTGRDLELVAVLASHWGVDAGDEGKTLWFELGGGAAAAGPSQARPGSESDTATFPVRLLRLPVALVAATVQNGDALLRERALLALGEEPVPSGSTDWRTPGLDLSPVLAAVEEAAGWGAATVDVEVRFPEGSGQAALERLTLNEEADGMAEAGLLLSPPALPEIALCRRWLLGQITLQAEGARAEPWALPSAPEPAGRVTSLSPPERARLDGLAGGIVVADAANRIVYANAAAGELLGWDHASWSVAG